MRMAADRYSKEGSRLLAFNPVTHTKIKTCIDILDNSQKVMKIFHKAILSSRKRYFNSSEGMSCSSLWDDALLELDILREMSHPNVLRLIDTVETNTKLKLVFEPHKTVLMEDCGNGKYKPTTDIAVMRVAVDISSALKYIHSNSICHRDVKPDNILVSYSGGYILADFGSARRTKGSIRESPATLAFSCPEATDDSVACFDAFKADLWALGLVVWCCIFKELPFEYTDDPLSLITAIKLWDVNTDERTTRLQGETRSMLAALLNRDPRLREYLTA